MKPKAGYVLVDDTGEPYSIHATKTEATLARIESVCECKVVKYIPEPKKSK